MPLNVGLIGCGNISDTYLRMAPLFRDFAITVCADLRPEAATSLAGRYGVRALSVENLLAADEVDVVLNLTIPEAHAQVSLQAIAAGKHVYTEKPLATQLADGEAILAAADAAGVQVCAAPDTILGAGVQTARRMIDEGAIGRPILGTAAVVSHGMEHWHPNPAFFYKAGGGPVFDMGPYYLAALVTLLGPINSVFAMGQIGTADRLVTAPASPRNGESIRVETPTTLQALLGFASGAQITFVASWDVWNASLPPIELHGTEGSLRLPDPNWFGGDLALARRDGPWETTSTDGLALGRRNMDMHLGAVANFRGVGLADMAVAIRDGRPARVDGRLGLHVLAVMEAILASSVEERRVAITTPAARPAALGEAEGAALLV